MSTAPQEPIDIQNVRVTITAVLQNPAGHYTDETTLPFPAQLVVSPRFREAAMAQLMQSIFKSGGLTRHISDDELEGIPLCRVHSINIVLSKITTPGLVALG